MHLSHQAFQFEAFNCKDLEDVLMQSTPQGCLVKGLDGAAPNGKPESTPKHEYTILQRVSSFEYLAILYIIRRSRNYYDNV